MSRNEALTAALGSSVFDLVIRETDESWGKRGEIKRRVEDIERHLLKKNVRLLSVRVGTTRPELLLALQDVGYHYAESILSLTIPLKEDALLKRYIRFPVRLASAEDLDAVQTIACSTFTENRLMRDPNFSPETVIKYYRNWIDDIQRKSEDSLYVLEIQNDIKGFYALRKLTDDRVNLLLAGVKDSEKNSLFGLSLYCSIHQEAVRFGFRTAEGEILASNIAVMNIFTFLGAKFNSNIIRLHKWFQ